MNKITLKYQYDSSFFDPKKTRDDFGRLSVSVVTDDFSGTGGFWVQWQDVKEFGEALSVYPIKEDSPVVAQWGFEMQQGNDLILRFEISPADKRGNLVMRFEVADDHKPHNRARGMFQTNYPNLDAFRVSIAQLMYNQIEEAILMGD